MTELNAQMFFGFLIWSVFCLIMLAVTRISRNRWKRAAHVMEAHANHLQTMIDFNKRTLWDSIPTGVITHAKKQ